MSVDKLKQFLDADGVRYVGIRHSPAYTAQETAASAHVRGKDLAKTVVLKIDGEMAMAVLPASRRLDLARLQAELRAQTLELATEAEFADLFPDCETGAMPPFGNLYDLPVYVSPALAADERIAFNAGSHTELLQLAYADFERLVSPTVVPMSSTD